MKIIGKLLGGQEPHVGHNGHRGKVENVPNRYQEVSDSCEEGSSIRVNTQGHTTFRSFFGLFLQRSVPPPISISPYPSSKLFYNLCVIL